MNISHWLSQNSPARPYAADWFTAEDVAWIAAQGFDHLRVPVDGRLWMGDDGSLDVSRVEPFDRVAGWAQAHGLGVILDMHFLPGADFNHDRRDATLFTDPGKLERAVRFWGAVAERYATAGTWLRFELLNEPVAEDNRALNPFQARMLAAIRRTNPDRVVYFTSNRWGSFGTVEDVEVPDDPHVAFTFHFYEPFIFTHQRASWVDFPPDMPVVPFPGRVPDLAPHFPESHWVRHQGGRELTIEGDIDARFARLADWAVRRAAGREIHIGEFGAYQTADAASRRAYAAAVRGASERHGFGWAVWDYRGGFAVRGPDGNGTAILEGLFPPETGSHGSGVQPGPRQR